MLQHSGIPTVSDTLARVAGHVPTQAVSPAARARVSAVAATLPAALTDWIYLESRLAPGVEQVDLIVGTDARGRAVLTGEIPAFAPAMDSLMRHPIWQRVRSFAWEWARPASPLYSCVRRIWLEFDIEDAPTPSVPVPGVFVDFTEAAGALSSGEERWSVTRATLQPLLDAPPAQATADRLRYCLAAIPRGGRAIYVGVLLSRTLDAVRLCLKLHADTLPRYLERIGWPGDAGAFLRSLGALAPGTGSRHSTATLHLDVGETILPRIGLEYPLDRRSQMRGEIANTALLDDLVSRGLCSRHKREALQLWPGYSFEVLDHEVWPSLLYRRVNHLKAMYIPGRPPEVKAYFCLHHEFHKRGWRAITARSAGPTPHDATPAVVG